MESRRGHTYQDTSGISVKSTALPHDYLQLVREVFATNFDTGLKTLSQQKAGPKFEVNGSIFSDEIVMAVSLTFPGELSATTAYASIDFDPKASSPTIQDLLAACVDALGGFWGQLLSSDQPELLAKLADASLTALENIPFQWSLVELERHKIFLKVDKTNLSLDQMADEWLNKNDPKLMEQKDKEQEETEKLFFTGPKRQ